LEAAKDTSWNIIYIQIPEGSNKFFQQNYVWNFSSLPVGFEDAVKYYASLSDNDQINGPKFSRTPDYFIRFPSLEQLFDEFAEKQEESQFELKDLADDSEQIQKKLEEINRELKREKNIDWERKKQIESTLEEQKAINDKIEKIQQELDEAINKLEQNQLFSPEILEKYNRLQELFQEIASPELIQAMQELQKALDDLNRKQVQNSLQKFKFNQEQFKNNLDRTLELFKRVQLEQEIDRLVKMAENLLQEQDEITKELKEDDPLNNKKMEGLKHRGEEQKKALDQTEEILMSVLDNKLTAEYPQTMDQLQQGKEYIDEKQLHLGLNELQQLISSGQKMYAETESEAFKQELQQLYKILQNARQDMIRNEQQRIMAQMQKVTERLLKLSDSEEKLMQETKGLSNFSDQFKSAATQQQQITENMSRVIKDMIDLSQQTFFIPPELNKSLGNASGGMHKSLRELENRNQRNASKFQEQAMSGLNEAAMQMQDAMQMMSQSGSALGFEQFMKRMEQMAGQQGQLNEQGLDLFNRKGNSGRLTMEQQGQMRRMAAEQRALQNSLEQLYNETGDRSDILGRLGNMVDEMEEVVKDLESLKIDRNTIARQQKILSRMLDAQKSVREKEYSRKRKAEIGKNYARKSPSEKTEAINKHAERLRLSLIQALQEGYNPDYEKIIEDYFRRLSQEEIKK
jgi:hypothetical protein